MLSFPDQPQPETEPDWQPTADLAITMAAVPASVASGAASQVTATVTNEGPGRAIGAEAVLTLPAGLTAGTLPAAPSRRLRSARSTQRGEWRQLTGDLDAIVLKALREDPASEYLPVGFLDDDPARARLQATNSR